MSDRLQAIELATRYIRAHEFKKRMTDRDRERRKEVSEEIRLGGMRIILEALVDE